MKKRNSKLWVSVLMAASLTAQSPALWATDLMGQDGEVNTYKNPDGSETTVNTRVNKNGLMGENTLDIQKKASENNVKAQGEKASGAQNMGMIAGIASAAFSGAMAASTCSRTPPAPSCPAWIAGAMASALIAALMAGAKNKSDNTVADVTSPKYDDPHVTPTPDPRLQEVEQQITDASRKIGAVPDTKNGTLKLKDGRTLNAADLNNKAALAAAGFSPNEIASFQDAMAKTMKEGTKAATEGALAGKGAGQDEGVSVGGSSSGGTGSAEAADSGGKKGLLNRDPAQVAGLSKNFNGDPIGVASENLFILMNRRYDHSAQHNIFLLNDGIKKK